jgi:hypothetical protein
MMGIIVQGHHSTCKTLRVGRCCFFLPMTIWPKLNGLEEMGDIDWQGGATYLENSLWETPRLCRSQQSWANPKMECPVRVKPKVFVFSPAKNGGK